ncbi:ABC transporter ATP-binding protein [Paraflavisolibacter sp. H34]|uniref:ABC transporter ATP-binding protein n=1 Tax=Huijunlia imazamoxiresistens TaxID=3127457 RepID=UPI00301B52B9
MLYYVIRQKSRVKDFFTITARGFGLMWHSARKLTVINLVINALQAVLPLLSLLILKHFIEGLLAFKGLSWERSGSSILLFFGVQAASLLVTELSSYFLDQHQQVISDDMSRKVLHKAVALDLEYFEDPDFYNELYMVQQQSRYRPAELITSLQGFIQSTITIILFSGFLFSVHWSIPLLLVVLSIPLAVIRLMQGYQQFLLKKNCASLERRASDLFDYLTSYEYAKEVRIFHYGSFFIHRFSSIRKAIFRKGKRLQGRFLRFTVLIQFFEIGVVMLIYGIILNKTVVTAVSIGGLVVYLTSFQRLQGAIGTFYQSCIHLFQQHLYLQQVLDYLAIKPRVKSRDVERPMPSLSGGIQVTDLSFTYPQTNRQVLKDINMHFPVGKIVAIVGENGSGKSTLVKLLCRLYDVPQDTVFLGDTDITCIAQDDIRRNITALFQDFGKYYLSVRENIALGTNRWDELRMEDASQKSGFGQYLNSFPLGLDTQLGRTFKKGEQLSGGQWQKLALSRALYKKSPILILDEPTSALDPVSEYEVLHNLKQEGAPNRVIILISHRLYNLKAADYIYVLDNGTIAESGTFDDLLARKGLFFHTYKTQMI